MPAARLTRLTRPVAVSLAVGLAVTTLGVGVAAAALPGSSQAPKAPRAPRAAGISAVDQAAVSRALARVTASGAPGVLVQVREGAQVWSGGRGVANRVTGAPAAAADAFRAGSVTKTFVSTVVLQLVGQRKISLDQPVARYLPGALRGRGRITVRELLAMTSGVYDYVNDLPANTPARFAANRQHTFTPARLVAKATAHPQVFAPGHRWAYSNTNFIVLGQLVEKVTRHPLATELRTRIITPLRLTHTAFPLTSPAMLRPHLNGYHPNGASSTRMFDSTAHNPSVWWATGALTTTAGDLNVFFRALLGGRLLPAAMLAQMERTHATGWSVVPNYGLGLIRRTTSCGVSTLGHSGIVEGFTTLSFSSTNGSKQITVAANTSNKPAVFTAMTRVIDAEFCPAPPRSPAAGPDAGRGPAAERPDAATSDFYRFHL